MIVNYVKGYQIKTDFNCATNCYKTSVANIKHDASPTIVSISFDLKTAKNEQSKWCKLAKTLRNNNELIKLALNLKPSCLFRG